MVEHRVNNLIQTMCRRPETMARLNAEPEKVFEEFGLSETEKQALRSIDPGQMAGIGAHPILQMHYMMARNPGMAQQMSIAAYPELLED
jgi:2'-aminobiphenyl-2,3-diol 1,2-dioxygenase small subunit